MGCRLSKQGPASEKSISEKAAALAGPAAADPVAAGSHLEATSDATSVASQYGSSAHTSQAAGLGQAPSSVEAAPPVVCPVTGAAMGLASSNHAEAEAAARSGSPCSAGPDGEAPKLNADHKYNSFERPLRPSLRSSVEYRRTSEAGSTGRRAVGFSIDESQPVCPLSSRDSGKYLLLSMVPQAHLS
jgi:hypothetical protein